MTDQAQTLLQWSAEHSKENPDLAALLARAAALILARQPRKVVQLDDHREVVPTVPATAPVKRLPTVRPDFKMTPARSKILEVVTALPGSSIKEICDYCGIDRNWVGVNLAEMEKAGLVKHELGVSTGVGMGKAPYRWFTAEAKGQENIA